MTLESKRKPILAPSELALLSVLAIALIPFVIAFFEGWVN